MWPSGPAGAENLVPNQVDQAPAGADQGPPEAPPEEPLSGGSDLSWPVGSRSQGGA